MTSVIEPGRWLCPLPLSHIGGLMVLLRSWLTRTTAVLGPADTPDVTVASLVPTQLARLIHRPPPASLQCVMLGGAPADPTLLVRAREAGWPVRPSYGLTQACSAVTLADVGDVSSSGRPLPGLDVSLAEDGEIIVAGPSVVGGVHATGDLGSWDGDRLVVHGRKVDTIVSGGENVMPQEVEAVLLSHPAVAEAARVRAARSRSGARPSPRSSSSRADAPDLREFAAVSTGAVQGSKEPSRKWGSYRATPRASSCAASWRRTSSGRSRCSSRKRRTTNPFAREHGVLDAVVALGARAVVVVAVDLDVQAGPAEVELEAEVVGVDDRLGEPGAADELEEPVLEARPRPGAAALVQRERLLAARGSCA